MTRPELADFIRRFATGTIGKNEWDQYVTQHYADIETELARVRFVKLMNRRGDDSPIGVEADLRIIADMLLAPVLPGTFYFKDGAAGILKECLPLSGNGVISYEPYRSGSHFDMHEAIRAGAEPVCEYMHEDARHSFRVIQAPAYGKLNIKL